MITFKTQIGREYQFPSRAINNYLYRDGNYVASPVQLLDQTECDVIEGDGKPDYRCNELVDLLSKQRALASDVMLNSQRKKNDMVYRLSIHEESIKRKRASVSLHLSKEGWAHKTKNGEEIKQSSGILDELVDGDSDVSKMAEEAAKMQLEINNLSAKIQAMERLYFNTDSAVKQISKMLGF